MTSTREQQHWRGWVEHGSRVGQAARGAVTVRDADAKTSSPKKDDISQSSKLSVECVCRQQRNGNGVSLLLFATSQQRLPNTRSRHKCDSERCL
ncbi:hypothetical protein E2C01_014645 [Portunus trituberculatus]|uniref:Uncharacterized protein n=1 Tax=Portunus trituberculatus TaxID=210409 RepID=A0A5B7DKW3_PORTR|nr:hypothetical protein [Portunus trituberculatus]